MATRELLLHPRTAMLVVSLKEDGKKWYASSLARAVGLSYVYVTEVLNTLQRDGVVEFKREGKIKRVMLTEKGMKIANALDELMTKLNTIEAKEESKPAQDASKG